MTRVARRKGIASAASLGEINLPAIGHCGNQSVAGRLVSIRNQYMGSHSDNQKYLFGDICITAQRRARVVKRYTVGVNEQTAS